MRIIGGEDAGRRLKGFRGREIRPTPDRVREAVFSMLGDAVRGARVLDLFAGTGAMGLEALSRGASEVVFVDSSPRSATIIRENLNRVGRLEQGRVLRQPAHIALAGALQGPFHLIFSDPPYRMGMKYLQGIYLSVLERDLLEPGGLLVAEGPASRQPELRLEGLAPLGRKIYGDTAVDIYRRGGPEEKGE
jgi:16S rRNA (guanine966-N2)-methyltransferase